MSETTLKRADKKSYRNNKNSIYKMLAAAAMAVLMAAAMVVLENPNAGMTAADTTKETPSAAGKDYAESVEGMFERGASAVLLSQGALNVAYDNEEDLPDVEIEAFRKLINRCMVNLKLTSLAAAVQTVPEEAVANDDGTYSLTVPVGALLTTGVESVDRLALYAVLEASDEIGAKLVEVPYEPTTGKMSLPLAKILLIIDQKGDGDEKTTTGSETSTEAKKPRETRSAQSRDDSTTAEYVDSGEELTDEPETKPTEKQTAAKPTKENVSPVTGGHDF
jgi:hypothetical protein